MPKTAAYIVLMIVLENGRVPYCIRSTILTGNGSQSMFEHSAALCTLLGTSDDIISDGSKLENRKAQGTPAAKFAF